MNNNLNLSDDKMNALLKIAANKLGKDPQELKNQIESGNMDNILGGMDPKAAGKVNSMLQNPKAVEALLGNDKIRNMLSGMADKK